MSSLYVSCFHIYTHLTIKAQDQIAHIPLISQQNPLEVYQFHLEFIMRFRIAEEVEIPYRLSRQFQIYWHYILESHNPY